MALALGTPVGLLSRTMSESEFVDWQRYAGKRMLPMRRMELHLAQIALKIVQTMGGNHDAVLRDYLFDPVEEDESSAEEFFGFSPRK